MCQSSGAAWLSVSYYSGQKQDLLISSYSLQLLSLFYQSYSLLWLFCMLSFFLQLCVERCPDRHLTLIKAKLGSLAERKYYEQYCKEGVDITTVNILINYLQYMFKWFCEMHNITNSVSKTTFKAVLRYSECSWNPEG